MEELVAEDSFEDQGVLSPDNTKLAYVSSANDTKANIWVKDLITYGDHTYDASVVVSGHSANTSGVDIQGETRCLTNTDEVKGNSSGPGAYLKPHWAPNGNWIAFSSDRNTRYTEQSNGWENTQELSIYAIRPDGTGFKKVVSKQGYSLGGPKWSSDGKQIIYYEIDQRQTYAIRSPARMPDKGNQIWSVDVETGETKQETDTNTNKVSPQYVQGLGVGYLVKKLGEEVKGIHYNDRHVGIRLDGNLANPSWSPDGKQVVFEVLSRPVMPYNTAFNWQNDWLSGYSPLHPGVSKTGKMASEGPVSMSLVIESIADGTSRTINLGEEISKMVDNATSFRILQPSWTGDEKQLVFGAGHFFSDRVVGGAAVYRINADGSQLEKLTEGGNKGFPSYSPDGKSVVYRNWAPPGAPGAGLYIYDFATKVERVLTSDTDNLPSWSPDGERIVFTRKTTDVDFEICTVGPDGKNFRQLTASGGNKAHPIWIHDGKIAYSSGEGGWRAEAVTYSGAEQPYGQVWIMDADGSNKWQLTDSLWETSMPIYLPNELLRPNGTGV